MARVAEYSAWRRLRARDDTDSEDDTVRRAGAVSPSAEELRSSGS